MTSTSPGETAGTDEPDNPPEPCGPLGRSNRPVNASAEPVDIIWAGHGSCALDLPWLKSKLIAVCGLIDRPVDRLAVRIVADAEMSALHERHANVPGTTDVLTFDNSRAAGPIDVDIAVCVEEAARRAAELGHTVERELLLYCVHGLLHCLGFDDHDPRDHERMHAEEDRLLEAAGVGRTFAPARGDAGRQTE
jgi:probable rRNA maturation factor